MGALQIANALAPARRAVRLYPPEHPTHREALADLVAAVTESVDVRPLSLNIRNGRLYEGSDVVTDASPAAKALAEAMEVRRIESLTFHIGFGQVDAIGISEVLSLRPSPELQVQVEMEERGVQAVTVSELEDNSSAEAEERDRRREADRALYRHALAGLKDVVAATGEGTHMEPLVAMRTLAELIERVTEDLYAIIALAGMTGHGERSRFHAVGVMLHALVLGRVLELPDHALLSLGLAALLHDAGMTLPIEGDADALRAAHPIAGARALGSVSDADCFSMIVAYEHHMGADGSGFPERDSGYATHPYSRIVAVVDRYDGLTRPATGPALRPDEAVAQLLREASGGPLDPVMTRMFVQALGVIPVGSAVRLADHSVGIVREPGPDPLRPCIRLILCPDGTEMRPAIDVDLVEDERAIVDVIPTDLIGVHASDYL
ncbi:MAG: HD domain-containing phosphohydrolase [Coriobacteriia bacterium]